MFKLFKSKQEDVVISNKSSNIYPKEVMEIHHEFETASDKLLENAYNIINSQPKVNESKVERLKKFGFKQVKEIEEVTKVIEATSLSKEQIQLIQYYKQNYPFNKFITEKQVKEICHKYNLVCGDVNRFTGFVPDANLNDLEKFRLKDKDITVQGVLWGSGLKKEIYSITLDTYNILLKNKQIKGEDKDNLDGDQRWCHASDLNIEGGYNYFDNIEKSKLQICASIKDMDIKGLELVEGYKLQKPHIPDPVILQPIKGGYLIITAWGDEASDPLVVNEINN